MARLQPRGELQGARRHVKAPVQRLRALFACDVAHHMHAVLLAQTRNQPVMQRATMRPCLLCQRFGRTVERVEMVAVRKEEVPHRLERHGLRRRQRLGQSASVAHMHRHGLQPLHVGLVAGMERQQGARHLRQLGGHLTQLGQCNRVGRLRAGRHGVTQLRHHARLFVLGKLLDIDAQHLVDLQQHRHGERPLVLLNLVEIAGRQPQRLRQRHLRHAALGAQAAQAHAHEGFGHSVALLVWQPIDSQNLQNTVM
ncbi:hypothetical protein SDC9_104617 [bioreactor metagenome]|uniref:Uncharacterized protein n=1 Tax=bioreactor metagenome TaxID=1076179 RepID=A0A645B7X5_9ZZZZ